MRTCWMPSSCHSATAASASGAAGEQDAVVGDPDLRPGGAGGSGEDEQKGERGEGEAHATSTHAPALELR